MHNNSKFLDLVVQKDFEDYRKKIGFSSNIFMVFGLPTQKLKENPFVWKKETSFCNLTIVRHEKYEIPYGCYARMNQIFIDTEIKTKCTNVIDIGDSFREYTHKLGYKDGKANKMLVKQLINYITSTIRVEPKNNSKSHLIGIQSLVAKAWNIYFDFKDPNQTTLFKSQILLDETFAKYIHKHSVPLDLNIINAIKRNPLALDFYRFLAYRNNGLNKSISFPDYLLFEQLGTEQSANKVTRARLKNILKAIQLYWPVKAKFEDEYFELYPSSPAVSYKIPSGTDIKIVTALLN